MEVKTIHKRSDKPYRPFRGLRFGIFSTFHSQKNVDSLTQMDTIVTSLNRNNQKQLRIKSSTTVPFKNARRYFISRTSSYVGVLVPTFSMISERKRVANSGCSHIIYTANVKREAVYADIISISCFKRRDTKELTVSRPATKMFVSSSRMTLVSINIIVSLSHRLNGRKRHVLSVFSTRRANKDIPSSTSFS